MEDENDDIHGNSKESKKLQHLYEIFDTEKTVNDTVKYGISGDDLNKNSTSKRANEQVNKLNKKSGWKRFVAFIREKFIDNRKNALLIEKEYVKEYKKTHNNKMPPMQKRPKVE